MKGSSLLWWIKRLPGSTSAPSKLLEKGQVGEQNAPMPREPFAFGTGFPEAVFARPGVPGLLSARDARNHPLGRETKRGSVSVGPTSLADLEAEAPLRLRQVLALLHFMELHVRLVKQDRESFFDESFPKSSNPHPHATTLRTPPGPTPRDGSGATGTDITARGAAAGGGCMQALALDERVGSTQDRRRCCALTRGATVPEGATRAPGRDSKEAAPIENCC